MGLALSPLPATLWLLMLSIMLALMSIIIPLPSLAGPGGVFDTPLDKCPLVGSVEHVRDGPPSSLSKNQIPAIKNVDNKGASPGYPMHTASSPIDFNKRRHSNDLLATPPLTPENCVAIPQPQKHSAFPSALFSENASTVAKYSVPIQISSNSTWEGFELSLPNWPKTLYVDGSRATQAHLRESIVALLDLADEQLECSSVIIALRRNSPELDALIHGLMYVGGQVVTRPPFKASQDYILIGLEI